MAEVDRSIGAGRQAFRDGSSPMSLVEFAAAQLRENILSGELGAGERIRLDEIAGDLKMSPIPLREALRTLATEGLVIPAPHRGYTVSAVTVADLDDIYRMRLILEPLAVRLAVPHLEDDDLEYLREELDLVNRAVQKGDWPDHRLHHRAFHFGIYDRCESSWLLRFTDTIWLNAQRYQRMSTRIKGELAQRRREHEAILAACEEHDAESASALMHDHLKLAGDRIRAFLSERESENAQDRSRRGAPRRKARP